MEKSNLYNRMMWSAFLLLIVTLLIGIANMPGLCAAGCVLVFIIWFSALSLPEEEKYK